MERSRHAAETKDHSSHAFNFRPLKSHLLFPVLLPVARNSVFSSVFKANSANDAIVQKSVRSFANRGDSELCALACQSHELFTLICVQEVGTSFRPKFLLKLTVLAAKH